MSDLTTTTMPSQEDIVSRLTSVSAQPEFVQGFYPHVAKVAGRELAGPGVVMTLTLAIYDYTQDMPVPMRRVMSAVLNTNMAAYVEALVDDEQVKREALEMIATVNTAVEQERAERPPKPTVSDADKHTLVRHLRRLAELVDEHVTPGGFNQSTGHRRGGANPYYNQTVSGLFLEFYYGTPQKIWTPWGEWHFAYVQSQQFDLEGFMSHLTTEVYAAERTSDMGVHGPVYAILAVDGEQLPTPEVLDSKVYAPMDYDTSHAEWKQFFGVDAY